MSQLKKINNVQVSNENSQEDEIITHLDILMNYEFLEQIESWEVLLDNMEIHTLIESIEKK